MLILNNSNQSGLLAQVHRNVALRGPDISTLFQFLQIDPKCWFSFFENISSPTLGALLHKQVFSCTVKTRCQLKLLLKWAKSPWLAWRPVGKTAVTLTLTLCLWAIYFCCCVLLLTSYICDGFAYSILVGMST